MRSRYLIVLLLFTVSSHALGVEQYRARVVEQKPQSRQNFVQGLEIVDGYLYVSSGNYGKSRLSRYHFSSGREDLSHALDARVFAEGLTVVGERVFQLTWRNRALLVYNRADLRPLHWFPLPGEGWGLTNNGQELLYSDGSAQLHYLSPTDGRRLRSVTVRERGRPVRLLNELEWVEGKVWANVWRTERIVIIDPGTGKVEGSIDLTGLLPASERRPDTDVLNGIARNPADGAIWVTGKHWPWLYRIELDTLEKSSTGKQPVEKSR